MKKSLSIFLALLMMIILSGCDTNTDSNNLKFSNLTISSVSYYGYSDPELNFDNYTDTEYIDIYFYSSLDQPLPESGDYQSVYNVENVEEVYFLFGRRNSSENHMMVAKTGVITVNGSTISFDNVTFNEYIIDRETNEIKSNEGEVTDSGTFTISN